MVVTHRLQVDLDERDEPPGGDSPLSVDDLADLRWYFEDYLRAPFGVYEERGARVASQFSEWGRRLFGTLFHTRESRRDFADLRARHAASGRASVAEIAVRSQNPVWLALPWELLCDPESGQALALNGIHVSRSIPAPLAMSPTHAPVGEPGAGGSPASVPEEHLRILMVIARPSGASDVGYQMIARPLLRSAEAMRGSIDFEVLRPPTLAELDERLRQAHTDGKPFHIVHFDGHGALSAAGPAALAFEKNVGGAELVTADRFAAVVAETGVSVVVLNACQSGAIGRQLESAIASRLLARGIAGVVGMAYRVYAAAAAEFMAGFYDSLFVGQSIGGAVGAGRARMVASPGRPSPKGRLPLADWAVPVHYWRSELRFPELRRDSAPSARQATLEDETFRTAPAEPPGQDPLTPIENFVGRDALIYELEAATRAHPVVLLHGTAGAGKTEVAKAFGDWLRKSGGVGRPEWVIWHSFRPGAASFGLDGVIQGVGLQAFGPTFAVKPAVERAAVIRDLLQKQRVLLIWDNFESVASVPDPDTPPLTEDGQRAMAEFLQSLNPDSRGAIVITSRNDEPWLGDVHRIAVRSLERHESLDYADQLLGARPAAIARRGDRSFGELLEFLNGHPLSMRLVLPQLEDAEPAEILAALRGENPAPDALLDTGIEYALARLHAGDRKLLSVLGLVEEVVDERVLTAFSGIQDAPQEFRTLTADRWSVVLGHAARVGLVTHRGDGVYDIHPALPVVLTRRRRAEALADHQSYEVWHEAAVRALLFAYTASAAFQHAGGRETPSAVVGFVAVHRRALGRLLAFALANGIWDQARELYGLLDFYWGLAALSAEARAWFDRLEFALRQHDQFPLTRESPAGYLWSLAALRQGKRDERAGNLEAAEARYTLLLDVLSNEPDTPKRSEDTALVLINLGMVAEQRGNWDAAETWYQRALNETRQTPERGREGPALRHLSGIAVNRGQWDEAERLCTEALEAAHRIGDRDGLQYTYDELGEIQLRRRRPMNAMKAFTSSLAIAEGRSDRDGIARATHSMGRACQASGRLDDAEHWLNKALTFAEEVQDQEALAASYNCLGMLASQRGKWDESESWYRKSLRINEDQGNHLGTANSLQGLGVLAYQRGDLDSAESCYARMLEISLELGDQNGASDSYHFLAALAYSRQQWERYIDLSLRIISINEAMGNSRAVAIGFYGLGELALLRQRNSEALEWVVKYLLKAYEYSDRVTSRRPGYEQQRALLTKFARGVGMPVLEECWERLVGTPIPRELRSGIEADINSENRGDIEKGFVGKEGSEPHREGFMRLSSDVTDNNAIKQTARSAALRLAAEFGPGLPTEVERALDARQADDGQYALDLIALGALLVNAATLAWAIYRDSRHAPKTDDDTKSKIQQRLRVSLELPQNESVAPEQRERVITVVVDEVLSQADAG